MTTYDYSGALDVARRAVLEAGADLRAAFHQVGPKHVDKAAELVIRRALTEYAPEWGYRGEETGSIPVRPGPGPAHCWVVDPNDGTHAFDQGERGSAVAIALLRDGVPILGVVYAFAAPDDEGDLFAWAEGCGPMTRGGRPVERGPWPTTIGPRTVALASDTLSKKPVGCSLCAEPGRFRRMPSIAYRLALAAAGECDAALATGSPCGWDYAAGHALLLAVGGVLINEHGEEVTYTAAGQSYVRYCYGGGADFVQAMRLRPWGDLYEFKEPHVSGPKPVHLNPGHAVAAVGTLRRAQGAMLGQLAGDALGSLVEFRSASEIRRMYPRGPRLLEDGGTFDTIAGQPTDDSELALMLARSIVAGSGYDPELAAQAYYYWYKSHPFDIGTTTAQAFRSVTQARVDDNSVAAAMRGAASTSSQSNGSLMRISPLAIWGHQLSAAQVAEAARADSALTHAHPVCQEACAVYSVALAHAVATGSPPADVYATALNWVERECSEQLVTAAVRDAAEGPPSNYQSSQGWVLIALRNAFYQLLHAPDFEEGVVRTVAAGGDTDTNGAIAGALLGAVYGREGVPGQWRQMILTCRPVAEARAVRHPRPQGMWPVDAMELAERLLLARRA